MEVDLAKKTVGLNVAVVANSEPRAHAFVNKMAELLGTPARAHAAGAVQTTQTGGVISAERNPTTAVIHRAFGQALGQPGWTLVLWLTGLTPEQVMPFVNHGREAQPSPGASAEESLSLRLDAAIGLCDGDEATMIERLHAVQLAPLLLDPSRTERGRRGDLWVLPFNPNEPASYGPPLGAVLLVTLKHALEKATGPA